MTLRFLAGASGFMAALLTKMRMTGRGASLGAMMDLLGDWTLWLLIIVPSSLSLEY